MREKRARRGSYKGVKSVYIPRGWSGLGKGSPASRYTRIDAACRRSFRFETQKLLRRVSVKGVQRAKESKGARVRYTGNERKGRNEKGREKEKMHRKSKNGEKERLPRDRERWNRNRVARSQIFRVLEPPGR